MQMELIPPPARPVHASGADSIHGTHWEIEFCFQCLEHTCIVKKKTYSRSVRGLEKDVSGKPYPRLCNVMRPRLEPRTFRSQAVRLYRLHQARPSSYRLINEINIFA